MTDVTIDVFIFQLFGMILENPRWSLAVNGWTASSGTLPVKTVLKMVEYEAPAC